jgi:Putative adhesin
MQVFETPEAINATIELQAGSVRITAADRADTVVDVRPSDPSKDGDVLTAEQTRVECSGGRLLVKVPRRGARWRLFEWGGSVEITVDLPTGSRVDVSAALADVRCEGRLGEARLTTSSGDISVARSGSADVTTSDGTIWIGEIDGTALVKTSNGDITLGEAHGDLRLNTANGNITVDRALAAVSAKTANGSVRIGEVVRGAIVLETAYGGLEVGVHEGSAAWLDVGTQYGSVRSSLEPTDGPGPDEETVDVRARTSFGDIVIHRS